jgi:hypothetical protein
MGVTRVRPRASAERGCDMTHTRSYVERPRTDTNIIHSLFLRFDDPEPHVFSSVIENVIRWSSKAFVAVVYS